jgi:hypothetical protein
MIHRVSASFRSKVFGETSFTGLFAFRTLFFNLITNLTISAFTWSSFVRLFIRFTSITWSIFFSITSCAEVLAMYHGWLVLYCFLECIVVQGMCGSGHLDSGRYKNSGQFHQVLLVESSVVLKPREGRSAGFKLPRQCLHTSLVVRSRFHRLDVAHVVSTPSILHPA